MRLLTWNINGVRTLPQYHPWNTCKNFNEILNNLGADILCFQEMKSGRKLLTKDVAVPESFDAFVSFPANKTGYSGVATYTRLPPLKAEEGLSGILQPKPPLTTSERISRYDKYPPTLLDDSDRELDFRDLDSEGRAIVLDFGLFVLINTYCPNDGTGTEERERFKMDYHTLLETRVRGLIEKEGREVIVVGDLNACAAIIDHCEGNIMVAKGLAEGLEGEEGFWGKAYRRRLRDWLQDEEGKGGPMVDIVRRFWPGRKGMYTCWNTKISARETNYGTRIDFILVTPGLLPWITAGDTLPNIKGSDHCPVYVDFHDEITSSDGTVVRLQDVLGGKGDPPRLATRFWEEFSGKQTSLQQFFGGKAKGSTEPSASPTPTPSTSSTPAPPPPPMPSTSTKRKLAPEPVVSKTEAKKKPKKGQQNIASFFSKPSTSKSKPETNEDDDEDYKLALLLSQESEQHASSPPSSQTKTESKQAWSNLLAPIQPPRCKGHDEPAREYTVNKPGPNKGKKFFICARPVGPGYDKGRSERMREHVDPQYRCDFFKWSSDVKKEMMKGGQGSR